MIHWCRGLSIPGGTSVHSTVLLHATRGLYGTQPGVQAALAYDAITLASEMARINGKENPIFLRASLESRNGFRGINGAFRIKSDGTTERGLALYRVINKQGTLLEPAASGFSAY